MSRSKKYNNPFAGVRYEHLVAGVSGGVASTLILHPLDLLKIRFAGKCFHVIPSGVSGKLGVCVNGKRTSRKVE